ncbi:MAG: hypothetical protein OXU61_12315, partial [Gammaproteobacteria bacterium]|nr:hypothetical protein [Gammaproteobacteria bacterium]
MPPAHRTHRGRRRPLFYGLEAFNRALAGWLALYNTERPRHSLQMLSPLQYPPQTQATVPYAPDLASRYAIEGKKSGSYASLP